MFKRTLNNTRHLEVDLVKGITFSDWENQLSLLVASNCQLSLNIGTTTNSIGTSLNNLGDFSGILTTTVNQTINDLVNYGILRASPPVEGIHAVCKIECVKIAAGRSTGKVRGAAFPR